MLYQKKRCFGHSGIKPWPPRWPLPRTGPRLGCWFLPVWLSWGEGAIEPSSPGAVVGCHGCIDGRPQGHDRFGELLRLVFPDRFLPKSSKSRRNVGNRPCKPLGMGRTAERAFEGRFWGALFDLFRSQTDWYAAPVATQSVAWRGKAATGSVPY